jgi:signal transduction histidine kinase
MLKLNFGDIILSSNITNELANLIFMTQPEEYIPPQNESNEKDELINRLTEEKKNLLKIISHDIRGPFNQIFALLHLLEMDSKQITEEQRIYIDKMYIAVIGGMEMVKNLNDSRSIDNGNITLNPEKFRMKQLIGQSVRNFSIQTRLKNITINFDNSVDGPEVYADKILFLKVLDNVISNAIKYSEKQKTINISLEDVNNKIRIRVEDHGQGLPDNELPMLFNKFQKLSSKPTLGEGATGLGLYLSRVFMEMMNGDIQIEKNPSSGLTVSINL